MCILLMCIFYERISANGAVARWKFKYILYICVYMWSWEERKISHAINVALNVNTERRMNIHHSVIQTSHTHLRNKQRDIKNLMWKLFGFFSFVFSFFCDVIYIVKRVMNDCRHCVHVFVSSFILYLVMNRMFSILEAMSQWANCVNCSLPSNVASLLKVQNKIIVWLLIVKSSWIFLEMT